MLLHPLINFVVQKYYENQIKFNGVCSGNNLPKIKGRAYLDEHKSIETHWMALYVND